MGLDPSLRDTAYAELEGVSLAMPAHDTSRPSLAALKWREGRRQQGDTTPDD